MQWLKELAHSLGSILRRSQKERELSEELQFHLERQIEQNLAAGMPPEEARYAALRLFGGLQQTKEECRDMRRVNYIENSLQDARYGLRQLYRSPGFTTVAVLTLALGVGANTAIFQLLDAVRLCSLPVKNPQDLAEVRIVGGNHGMGLNSERYGQLTRPVWLELREHHEPFSGVFAWAWSAENVRVGQGSGQRRANGLYVSGEFFPVLGVQPWRGRLIL